MKLHSKNKVYEVITAFLCILVMLPFLLVVINSSKTSFEITSFPLQLPDNFSRLFINIGKIWTDKNIKYPSSFLSSIFITAFSLILINLVSSVAAWVLVRTKTRTSKIIFLLFVGAIVIPFQIVMFPLIQWFRMLYDFTGIKLLRDYTGMILAYTGFGAPISIFMFHGFIKGVPVELEEAAIIDGCGPIKTFSKILFPILAPIQVTVLILNGIWIWNDYLLPLLILGKGNKIMTIPLAVANFAGAYVKQWDLILTAILMAMVPIVILYLFAQKYIIKGMIAGSIK